MPEIVLNFEDLLDKDILLEEIVENLELSDIKFKPKIIIDYEISIKINGITLEGDGIE